MGGIGSLYVVSQGMTPWVVLLVGRGSREWIEPLYASAGFAPLGRIWAVLPAGPDDPLAVLDACLAFLPEHFASVPGFSRAQAAVAEHEELDLARELPPAWYELRRQAEARWRELRVARATLEPWDADPYECLGAS